MNLLGGQPTCSKYLDIPAIIKDCGFKDVIVAETNEEITNGINRLREEEGVAMVLHTKQGSRDNLGRPTTPQEKNCINEETRC